MSDQASGDTGYVMTPDDSTKKPSLFGKLKDKTKRAGSKIKSKVTKNPEDGSPMDHDGDEEDDTASDEAQSPYSSTVSSTPRDYESEPSRFSGVKDHSEAPDVSGLSINEPRSTVQQRSYEEPAPLRQSFQDSYQQPSQESYQEPSYKPSEEPSYKPFEEPSYKSSKEPSYMSSQEPSYKSSEEPSYKSSEEPSYKSSQEPSYKSSQEPSYKPTDEPSYKPTDEPSYKPSDEPSYKSSDEPPYKSSDEPAYKSSQGPSYDSSQGPSYDSSQGPSYDSTQGPSYDSSQGPSVTEKASGAAQGAKDALYGGAAAVAGAAGYGAYKKHDEEKPVTEKASDATSDFGSKAGEVGDRGYGTATGAKDSLAKRTMDTFGMSGSEPSATDKAAETKDVAGSKAYEAKDAFVSKADDFNNATNDSETYTQKATNAATAAKDTAAGALGVGTAAEGPSLVEKAKQTMGFDSVPSDTPLTEQAGSQASETAGATQSKANETKDIAGSKAYEAKDALGAKAADFNNATDDSQTYTEKAAGTAQTARDSATEALGLDKPSEGPSLVEQAKNAAGFDKSQGPSVVDNAKENLASSVDSTKAYAADATATAQDYTTQAKNTVVDTATPKHEDKALSQKITETLGGLPSKAQDTASGYTQAAKSPTDPHTGEPASPGILGKLGGLFGYGAKAPEHHDAATTPTTTTPPTL